MKCQAIMKKNMNRPQRKAITIHPISMPWIGSFHQSRFDGGVIAMGRPRLMWAQRQLAIGTEATSITPQMM